ncbi:hypothetical protein JW859_10060 [bacterium]|nr:hypothetical protein [bacterium]
MPKGHLYLIVGLILTCLGVYPVLAAAAEDSATACARLLVLSPGEGAASVTMPDGNGDYTAVDLAPLMFLFAGDRLSLPAGANAVLLSYPDSTRQTHTGPSLLEVTADGLAVLEAGPTAPVVEQLELEMAPVVVGGRTDIRGATMYTRGDDEVYLEQVYPLNTVVAPGELTCEWVMQGVDGPVTFTLADQDYAVVETREAAADAGQIECAVEPDRVYYWRLAHPDASTDYVRFSVLDDFSWQGVAALLVDLGCDRAAPLDSIAELTDVSDLTCLLSVFQYYGLGREMQRTLTRLTAVLAER